MSPKHTAVFKTEQLSMSLDPKGKYWMYDHTRGMNLAMRSETERDAFIEALSYYHRRLPEVEKTLGTLSKQVESFVEQFITEDL